MSALGLETEGDDQNQNKAKCKTAKENNSSKQERSPKRRRFAVVETQDLDSLVDDSQAKKTKQVSQWAVSVFTGRCKLRFKIVFFHSTFSCQSSTVNSISTNMCFQNTAPTPTYSDMFNSCTIGSVNITFNH